MDIKDNHKKEILSALDEAIETALDAAGMQAATLSARELQNSPQRIDTGLLRNSITYAVDGEGASITSYSADRPSKYSEDSVWSILQAARPTSGTYSGTAPKEPEGRRAVYIGTNVDYAIYVHEGTSSGLLKKLFGKTDRMEPNRFLKKGVLDNREELSEIIKKTLQNG